MKKPTIFKKMKYRILESVYRNEMGLVTRKYFYIQYEKTIIGIKYWKTLEHEVCYCSGCHNVTTEFETYDKAKEFADNMLCNNVRLNKWTDTVISYNECA